MARWLGFGLVLAASAAAAGQPVASDFTLSEPSARPISNPRLQLKFEAPRIDYAEPGRPQRRQGFLAAVRVMPNGFLGIGMSGKKAQRSGLAPDPALDGRRGGRKLAVKFSMDF